MSRVGEMGNLSTVRVFQVLRELFHREPDNKHVGYAVGQRMSQELNSAIRLQMQPQSRPRAVTAVSQQDLIHKTGGSGPAVAQRCSSANPRSRGRTLNKNNAFPFPQDAFLQTGGNYRLATGYYLWSCGTFWNTTHSTKEMPPDQCFFHSHESRAAGRPALIAITSLPHGMPADSTKERRMISQTKLA